MKVPVLVAMVLASAITALASPQQVYSEKTEGITLPVLLRATQPQYTQEARDHHAEGTVTLDCDVLADGSVGAVMVTADSLAESYGLEQKAIEAVSQWTFRPGTKDAHAVAVRVSVDVKFTLARGGPQ
jgi:protein TonB